MTKSKSGKPVLIFMWDNFSIILIYALMTGVFSIVSPDFRNDYDLWEFLKRSIHIIILAVGLSIVIIGGQIDLSVGYQVSLLSVLAGSLMSRGMHPIWAALLTMTAGIVCGLFNGVLVTVFSLASFAATLASSIIFRGISYSISSGLVISRFPDSFLALTRSRLFGVTFDIWLAALCLAVVVLFFSFTYYGKYIIAMGENQEAVRKSGVNVGKIKIVSFAACSFFCSLASLTMVSRYSRAGSYYGAGLEITGITAAFLSGTFISSSARKPGGYRPWKMVAGVLMLTTIEEWISLIGWNQSTKYVIMGAVLAWAFTRSPKTR
jgi:ribose/xylose/arabinose/galactoside ABC-type transport system permease subunit